MAEVTLISLKTYQKSNSLPSFARGCLKLAAKLNLPCFAWPFYYTLNFTVNSYQLQTHTAVTNNEEKVESTKFLVLKIRSTLCRINQDGG